MTSSTVDGPVERGNVLLQLLFRSSLPYRLRDGINILLNIRDAGRIRIHLTYSTRNASR